MSKYRKDYDHPSHRPADTNFLKTQKNLAYAIQRGRELNEEERRDGPKCDRCRKRSHSVIRYGGDMLCIDCSEHFMMRD